MAITKLFPVLAFAAILGACATESPADAAISAAVREQLTASRTLAADNLRVTTRNGVVYLDGLVDTITERDQAEDIARRVPGVKHVVDMTGINGNAQ